MPITVLSLEESADERRRVKANEGGGDGKREAWKFLSHSKNSLDLGEIVNSVEYQEPKSGDVERRSPLNAQGHNGHKPLCLSLILKVKSWKQKFRAK